MVSVYRLTTHLGPCRFCSSLEAACGQRRGHLPPEQPRPTPSKASGSAPLWRGQRGDQVTRTCGTSLGPARPRRLWHRRCWHRGKGPRAADQPGPHRPLETVRDSGGSWDSSRNVTRATSPHHCVHRQARTRKLSVRRVAAGGTWPSGLDVWLPSAPDARSRPVTSAPRSSSPAPRWGWAPPRAGPSS